MSAVGRSDSVPRCRVRSRRIFGADGRAVTPMLSDADAAMVVVPETAPPLVGAVMLTVGATASPLLTVTITAADVFWFPAASRARAAKV